jgi:hypothetical protein
MQARPATLQGVPLAATSVGEIIVTAEKRVIESQLGDYKLYTLAEPTTLASRQTKQVQFLDQPAVKFQTIYVYQIEDLDESPETREGPGVEPTAVVLRLKNTGDEGLGRPLPAGTVQVRQPQVMAGGRELLLGEPALGRDVPVGEPFEIGLGRASDVTVRETLVSDTRRARGRVRRAYEVLAANAKAVPVTVEIRHARGGAAGFKVAAESIPHGLKAGDPVWRLTLPAGGEQTLAYAVEFAQR